MSATDPIAIFRVEAQELLDQIEQGLLDLAQNPNNREVVAAVFRALHTLKGSGAMFGFDDLAGFTHHCETAFDRVRRGEVPASHELVSAVLGAMDHMRALAERRPVAPGDGEALLATLGRVVGQTPAPSGQGAVAPKDADAAAAAIPIRWHIRFTLAADVLVNGTRPLPMLDELRAMGPCEVRAITDEVPPLSALTPTDCYLGWDVLLTTAQPRSAIEEVFLFVMNDMTLLIEALDVPTDRAPTDPAAPAAAALAVPTEAAAGGDQPAADAKAGRIDPLVRVPATRLDELMDRVGELVIAQSRLKQIAGTSIDMSLRAVAEEIEHLASELRDSMMSVRMVPVIQLFGRFRRLIHGLAHDTGKDIELVTEGETTELDKTVIERLADARRRAWHRDRPAYAGEVHRGLRTPAEQPVPDGSEGGRERRHGSARAGADRARQPAHDAGAQRRPLLRLGAGGSAGHAPSTFGRCAVPLGSTLGRGECGRCDHDGHGR